MNGEALIAAFRVDAQDTADGQLWADEDVMTWLTEAEAEAALRGRLLHESADPAICTIAVTANTASYALHPTLFELSHVAFRATGATKRTPLSLKSTEELDRIRPDWRDETGAPEFAIQTDTKIRLVPTPDVAGTVLLEGYRLPKAELMDDSQVPEINAAHHRHLVHWVLHRAYGMQDADTFDPDRSAKSEAAFTAYFGARPDSDLRRITRQDVDHHVQAHWV
jgi:hypothetical protein